MQRNQHQLAILAKAGLAPHGGLIANVRAVSQAPARTMNAASRPLPAPQLVTPPLSQLAQASSAASTEGLTRRRCVDSNCLGRLRPRNPTGQPGGMA